MKRYILNYKINFMFKIIVEVYKKNKSILLYYIYDQNKT